MTLSLINDGCFARVKNYLNTLDATHEKLVQNELDELRQTLDTASRELDPTYPHFHLVSSARKDDLLQRMGSCMQGIKKKLAYLSERPSQTILRRKDEILNLPKLFALTPLEFYRHLKGLDSAIVDKIYFCVWLVSGCPKVPEFSYELLKKNFTILSQKFPPLIDAAGGTLIEQMAADHQTEFEIQKEIEFIEDLSKHVGLSLHEISLHELRLDQLRQDRDQEKMKIFYDREKEVHFSHRQLKSLFKMMPASVQALLPKPPYYGRGLDTQLYKTLGAHYDSKSGETTFRLYAPRAKEIILNLTTHEHIEHQIPLVKGENGIWAALSPQAMLGRTYHYMIVGAVGGQAVKKIDPFAFGNIMHRGGDHESVVRDSDKEFPWSDKVWMEERKNTDFSKGPMTIYEVHAPTWKKRENGDFFNWRELATDLGKYCTEMGYTHVELMGVLEHPHPMSMGYQVSSFFTMNSQMGTMEDFQAFIDEMHQTGVGVFLDWVPAHFSLDEFALGNFDGSALFEDDDPESALHPTWGTYEFDFKKQYAKNFLASNADFILSKLHVDGLRMDAVASMLYLDYDRPSGSRTNEMGTIINTEAKAFLRNVNASIHEKHPGVLIMAEESSAYPNVVRPPVEKGQNGKRGLGFDLTWHMGFMNDILKYLRLPPDQRPSAHPLLISTLNQVDGGPDFRPRGKVVLPFSHDENANGQKTIQRKMPGSLPERCANGRLLQAFQLLRGGGPALNFMGGEFMQSEEWHGRLIESLKLSTGEKRGPSVQWEELDPSVNPLNYQYHRGALECSKALNQLYLHKPGLWDQTDQGFSWIDNKDALNSVVSFHRRGHGEQLACIFNFSDHDMSEYLVPLPDPDSAPELSALIDVREVFNTDDKAYAGQGRTNESVQILRNSDGQPTHLKLQHLPPFTAIVLSEEFVNTSF